MNSITVVVSKITHNLTNSFDVIRRSVETGTW